MTGSGRFAYGGLDRRLHEPARLGILTALASRHDGLTFAELRQVCDLTDGNLSSHVRHLEDAGYLASEKRIEANRPVTRCRMTEQGRTQFFDYLTVLQTIIRDATAPQTSPAAAPKTA